MTACTWHAEHRLTVREQIVQRVKLSVHSIMTHRSHMLNKVQHVSTF